MAKVSIIVPTYNVEMYLEECMESITRQTLKDIEIICINDGSTDGSLEILKKYAKKDSRIVLVDKHNEGYGVGMNIGLEKATGEYIGIVEPDDYVVLNMYEDLYKAASEHDLDFVKADFYRFQREENGNMELVYNHLSKEPERYNVVFNPSEDPSAMRFIMNTWSGIYKRAFLEEYHIRHNTTPGASFQDNGFWFQTFAFAKRAMILDRPYYRNRRDNPNSSVKNKEKVYCMNVEYDHIRDVMMEYPETWEKFKYMYTLKKWHNYRATLRRIAPEYRLEYCKRFGKEMKRAEEKGEMDQSLFTSLEWNKLSVLMADPDKFYALYIMMPMEYRMAEENYRNAERELQEIRNSTTFKIGKLIMYIPCRLKEYLKKRKRG